MRIANNISAFNAFNALNSTNQSLSKVINTLSTGLRINSAADDAAGFAISEKLRSQISGLDVALRNSQDGISLLQTAEGALEQTNSMLQRMRDLSVQASNDSLTSNDRQYIQLEIDQLRDEIDRIAGTTQFNKKRILDGSSGALWASSDTGVKVRVNGGLTHTDNFGQKVSAEGNYRIEVKANPGQAQVQKSHIYNIRQLNETVGYSINYLELNINDKIASTGETSGDGWNFSNDFLNITADGTYYVVGSLDASGQPIETSTGVQIAAGVKATLIMRDINLVTQNYGFYCVAGSEVDLWIEGENNTITGGASTSSHSSAIEVPTGSKLTISSMGGDYTTAGKLTLTGTTHGAGIGGSCLGTATCGDITILGGTIIAQGGDYAAGIGAGSAAGSNAGNCGTIAIYGGDVTAIGGEGGAGIGGATDNSNSGTTTGTIIIGSGATVRATGGGLTGTSSWNATGHGAGIGAGDKYSSSGMSITIDPRAAWTASGYLASGASQSVGSGQNSDGNTTYSSSSVTSPDSRTIPTRPTPTPIENERHTLSDIEQFYTSEGTFLMSTPKTITITQGDGKTAGVTLYENDTIQDVARKINDVIANTFGNAQYTDNPAKFCTISDGTEGTSESIYESEPIYDNDGNTIGHNIHATMLVRSGIPGKDGELYFSGDEDILNALGLNTIQESSESSFTASVYDAHSGAKITSGAKLTGNVIQNALTGVDIEFGNMAGIKSTWDESTKRYVFTGGEKYTANLHLKDNGITFQTGANRGEDFSIQLGDMSCSALGINGVNVATRESASRSIGILDRAISRVSAQRAKIGSYLNGLEYATNNLTATSANLTAADSRLRDADMALTMMDFVRLQILNQSGTSMLAQANQLPQSVLSLLQG